MKVSTPEIKLNHLVEYLISNYSVYGPKRKQNGIVFGKITKASELVLFSKKSTIPFKKILFPNSKKVEDRNNHKIALLGLNNCDLWALEYFFDQFDKTNLLIDRNNLLVVGFECLPDKNCFCDLLGLNKHAKSDIFIQKEKDGVSLFSENIIGQKILRTIGLKETIKKPVLRAVLETDKKSLNKKILSSIINEKLNNIDTWQALSNNCFGCGACSTVCPLCFCFRQEFYNDIDGKGVQCLKWDSCFAKRFSEIQNHHDLRPQNVDRFYDWYHHKFVRSFAKNNYFLCTGCGRCIETCPANLNIENIIKLFLTKNI